MDIIQCDGCQKVVQPTQEVYYSLGELGKHVPRSPSRMLFKDEKRELLAEGQSWVDYRDYHYCEACFPTATVILAQAFSQDRRA